MPRVTTITPALTALIRAQDGVVRAEQLLSHGFSPSAIHRRTKSGRWRRLLPGIILTVSGVPTRRQLLVAGWLWGGPGAAIDGYDACVWYGSASEARKQAVHVVAPCTSTARSCLFVRVRRASAEIVVGGRGVVPYVDTATAVIVAARNERSLPAAVAVLSRALQVGTVDTADLADARSRLGDKWCRPVDAALVAVGVGMRSPAENDARNLILTSRVLPEPVWNQWLGLPDGGPDLCVDGLLADAGMVVEVVGSRYHAWAEQFEHTQTRKERLVASGLVVCEVTPRRIRLEGPAALLSLEQTYRIHTGRGMPPGVRLLEPRRWSPPIAG